MQAVMLKGLTQFYRLTRIFGRVEYRNICIFYVRKQYPNAANILKVQLSPLQQLEQSAFNPA